MRFAPQDVAFIADPYPVYAELRTSAPVHHDETTDHWLVTRHHDVDTLLRDRRFGRTYLHTASHEEMGRTPPPDRLAPFWRLINAGILDMEGADHRRVRRLVSRVFTPAYVESLRPRIERIVGDLAGAVDGAGDIDLLPTIAEPLPVTVIAEMLGVPDADRHLLRPWSADICRMYELDPSPEAQAAAVQASLEFSEYLRALARERAQHPGEDLISELVQVVDEGDRLTEDELVGTCVLLLNAGHEATVNATLIGWWTLFRHPDQLRRLRADHGLIPTAVEELLRFDTPLQLFERWVLEPFELDGTSIPRGAELGLVFGSADRDPEAFERPDRLDIGRAPNPHLSFGAGIHFCLGAPLGRLELQTSFGALLERFPRMEPVEEPRWKQSYIVRGLDGLRVHLG